MDLQTLRKSVTNMTEDELLEELSQMRSNRRKKAEPRSKAKAKPGTTVKTDIAKMDKSKREMLLAALKELT